MIERIKLKSIYICLTKEIIVCIKILREFDFKNYSEVWIVL